MDQFKSIQDRFFDIKNIENLTEYQINKRRWITLFIVSMGTLLVLMGETSVTIALPIIKNDLNLSDTMLSWIVTIYLLSFGSFLLLSGKISDVFGNRRSFLGGIILFLLASLGTGLHFSSQIFLFSRAVQGIASALVSVASLSEILYLFKDTRKNTKALSLFVSVMSTGSSIGVLIGGLITNYSIWRYIFLINVPLGLIIFLFGILFIPVSDIQNNKKHIDILEAFSITGAFGIFLFIFSAPLTTDWLGQQTIILSLISVVLLIFFVFLEKKSENPLIPLEVFTSRTVILSSSIAVLCSTAMLVWTFFTVLYLQLILDYTPIQSAFAFLPATVVTALFTIFFSSKLVNKFGIKVNISFGLIATVLGLLFLVGLDENGNSMREIFLAMILLGIGSGIIFNPLLILGTKNSKGYDAGIVSGIFNSSFMMGGALGLAFIINVSSFFKTLIENSGNDLLNSLFSGYQVVFLLGAFSAFLALLLSLFFIQSQKVQN